MNRYTPQTIKSKKVTKRSYFNSAYVVKTVKEIVKEGKTDNEMANAIYIDFLQDFVLECGRGNINAKRIARLIHKECKFKIPL